MRTHPSESVGKLIDNLFLIVSTLHNCTAIICVFYYQFRHFFGAQVAKSVKLRSLSDQRDSVGTRLVESFKAVHHCPLVPVLPNSEKQKGRESKSQSITMKSIKYRFIKWQATCVSCVWPEPCNNARIQTSVMIILQIVLGGQLHVHQIQ